MRAPLLVIDALAARFGGTAYGVIQTARRLGLDERFSEVAVVAREGSIVADGLRDAAGIRLVMLRAAARGELPRRLGWEAAVLPRIFPHRELSVMLTWSGMLPRRPTMPVVSYISNPVMFEVGGLANRVRLYAANRTAARAAHTAAPTRAMARLVQRTFRVPVEIVPLGVDHDRFTPPREPGTELLCVADFYGHKRHDVVLEAWARLPEPRPVLRLIGDPRVDPVNFERVSSRAIGHRRLGAIEIEHSLSLGALVERYRRAQVFVIASEHESFCMPLLEGLACGVPAVARDLPALRETGGDGTTFVSGDEPDTWAAALKRLLANPGDHRLARERAVAHASTFDWELTARGLRTLLQSAAARSAATR